MTDVILIDPPFYKLLGVNWGHRTTPYIGLLYISAILKNNGFSVKVYDPDLNEESREIIGEDIPNFLQKFDSRYYEKNLNHSKMWEEIRKIIEKESPDIVGIGFNTIKYESAVKTARIVKEINKKISVIVGGIHPTILPKETIREPYFDIVVRGEGELTMLELVKTLRTDKNLKNVKGILFKISKKVIMTPPRPLIKDLDILPFPARDTLVNKKDYHPDKMGVMITSRGCPYNCAFCSNMLLWRCIVRFRSPENVIKEIEDMYHRYGTRQFFLTDEVFTLDKKRVYKICNLIQKRNLNISWACQTRIDHIDKSLIRKMRLSGCRRIRFGIETGNQKILNSMRKGITLNQIRKTIKLCKKEGITTVAFTMLGYPGETKNTLENTVKFIRELDLDIVYPLFTSPLPGTDLYKSLKKINLPDNWYDYLYHYPSIRLKNISKEDLWKCYMKLYKIQTSKKRKLRLLIKKIRRPFMREKIIF